MNVPMFLLTGVPIMGGGYSRATKATDSYHTMIDAAYRDSARLVNEASSFDRWTANTATSVAALIGASSEASYPRLKANCKNCGAPWEMSRCSYCLTTG